jgi:hypothetical protein
VSEFIYKHDLRGQDGLETNAENLIDNFDVIDDAIRGLGSENIEKWSLDQHHVSGGLPIRQIMGRHVIIKGGGPTDSATGFHVGTYTFNASHNSGVYIILSGTHCDAKARHADPTHTYTPIGGQFAPGTVDPSSHHHVVLTGSCGVRTFFLGGDASVHGGLGFVYAYQAKAPEEQTVDIHWHTNHPLLGWPIRANVVIYVVER